MLTRVQPGLASAAPDDSRTADVVMCATGRSGLGHLRRMTNIAGSLRQLLPQRDIRLISNAPVAALHDHERNLFSNTVLAERAEMARTPDVLNAHITVVDTAVLPGLHEAAGKLCLVLRETILSRLHEFQLEAGRKWDMVLVPNPKDHWLPDAAVVGADRVEPVGWIYRRPEAPPVPGYAQPLSSKKRVLIASGGGGNDETSRYIAGQCRQIVSELRCTYPEPLHIVQAAGPRMPPHCHVALCDEVIDPGPRLNELFGSFDLIISTAGYNSVLELAQTNRPVILLPIARSYDDQNDRARKWASQIGFAHQENRAVTTAAWATQVLAGNCRRRPYDLGASGTARAAGLLLELMQ